MFANSESTMAFLSVTRKNFVLNEVAISLKLDHFCDA